MIITFATKRDRNGNRRLLLINTNTRVYNKDGDTLHSSYSYDAIEVKARDIKKIEDICILSGYKRINGGDGR